MEYSFVHYAGTLWSSSGPVEPDGTLWHTILPLHPNSFDKPVPLESATGRQISARAIDLACVLLLQQPQQFAQEAGPEAPLGEGSGGDHQQRESSPRALGSVAALTGGLVKVESVASTQTRSRTLLETVLAGMDTTGWASLNFIESVPKPWRLMAVNPPRNFRQAPKYYARLESAERNQASLVQDIRVARAALALRTTRKQVGLRLSGDRPFSVLEVLLLSQEAGIQPSILFAA